MSQLTKAPIRFALAAENKTPLAAVISIVLVVAVALVYWRTLSADFVAWDDDINVYQNTHIQGLDAQRIAWMFADTQAALRYKPLSWLLWAVIYSCGGLKPFGFHLANVVLHCLNTLLVFAVISRLLLRQRTATGAELGGEEHATEGGEDGLRLLVAGWAALLWGLHPLRVEPVAWVTGMPYSLSLFFLLLSFWFYSSPPHGLGGPKTKYWASVACFLFSALSYPVGLTYPLILVILDFAILTQWAGWKELKATWSKVLARSVPFFAVAILIVLITLRGRVAAEGIWQKPVSLAEFGLLERFMQAFYIWACYLWKFWTPFDLSPVYTTLISFKPLTLPFMGSALLVITLSIWVSWKRRKWPMMLALWLCYLVLLIPVLGLTEHPHFPSDRYGHLVGILWSVLLATGLVGLLKSNKRRPFLAGAALSMLLGFAILAARQVPIWQNGISLFSYALESNGEGSPYQLTLLTKLATEYKAQRQYPAALGCYAEILKVQPANRLAHENMLNIFLDLRHWDEAREHGEALLRIAPGDAANHNNLGIISASTGNWTNAMGHFQEALRINPKLNSASQNLARVSRKVRNQPAGIYFETTLSPTNATPAQ